MHENNLVVSDTVDIILKCEGRQVTASNDILKKRKEKKNKKETFSKMVRSLF